MAGKFQVVMDCLEDLQRLGSEDAVGVMTSLAFFRNYELGQDRREKAPKDPLTRVDCRERARIANSEMKPKLSLDARRRQHRETPVLTLEEHKRATQGLKARSTGAPMCLSVSPSLIAVGSEAGLVHTFELSGKRGRVLSHPKHTDFAAVTALGFCEDGSLLLAGHGNGQVVLWDISQGVPLCSYDSGVRSAFLQVRVSRSNGIHGLISNAVGLVASCECARSMFFDMELRATALDLEEAGPCVSIEPLAEGPKGHALNAANIVAFGMASTVLLYSFQPKKSQIARIEVPKSPYLSWAWGPTEPLLGVASATSVALYRLKANFKAGVTSAGYCTLASEARALHLTPCGKVVVVDNFRDFRVFALRHFARDPHEPADKKALLQVVKSDYDLHFSRILHSEADSEYYHNSTFRRETQIFVLGHKRLYIGEVLPWRDTENRLIEKASWLDAFAFAVDLYAERLDTGLDLEAFKTFSREVICAYMDVKVLKWENKMPIVVEFCVATEATSYLLGELSQVYLEQSDNQSYLNALLQALEPYIFSDYITVVPTFVLGKVLAYYINESQSEKIEMMVMHLDAKALDMQNIRGYCDQYLLITAEIYLSTHASEPDFMDPIMFICKAIEEAETEKRKEMGLKLMWYLRLTLAGELFPSGLLQNDQHSKVAVQLLAWLLLKTSLKLLLSLDFAALLELLWTVFVNKKLVLVIETSHEITHSVILQALDQVSTPEIETPVSVFISKAMKVVPAALEEEMILRIVRHLMSCHISEKQCRPIVDAQIVDTFEQLEGEIEFCIIAVLDSSRVLKDASLAELIKLGAQTRYSEVMVYLQEKAGDIPSCLKSFFLNENPQLQARSFEWIEEVFENISRKAVRTSAEDFRKNVAGYLPTLAELDSGRTVKLVSTQFEGDHQLVVGGLQGNADSQLSYLESWRDSSGGSELPPDMLQLYLKLLCSHRPADVLEALKKIEDIPYDLCLSLCKQRNLTDAIAYLYETQGDHKGALDTYVQIIEDRRIRLEQRMAGSQELSKSETNELREVLAKAMLLCERCRGEADYWYALMDKIFESFKTFMPYFPGYPKIEEITSQAIRSILGKIVTHMELDEVVSRLVDNFRGIPFLMYKQELISILKSYSFQKQLLRSAQGSLGRHMKDLAHSGLMFRKQGVTSKSLYCMTCQKLLCGSAVLLFVCGHGKHEACSTERVCDLCQAQEFKQSKMRGLLSSKAK